MRLHKGFVAACSLVAAMLWIPGQVIAKSYPTKTVQIIVAYPPGGSGDLMARVIAERMASSWGQQVVVFNRPGAAGMIGAAEAAKSPTPSSRRSSRALRMLPVTSVATNSSSSSRSSSLATAISSAKPSSRAA